MEEEGTFVDRLPSELLLTIFLLVQLSDDDKTEDQNDEDSDSGGETPSLPAEVLVSHVSRYWRATALGAATLWRTMRISVESPFDKLQAYVARSGALVPLHFQVDLRHSAGAKHDINVETTRMKLDMVFAERERWQRMRIHTHRECADFPLFTRLYELGAAPLLERLVLCVDDVDANSLATAHLRSDDLEQILTSGCPKLRVLRLRGLSTHFFRPSLKTVTTLYIEQTRGLFLGFAGFRGLLTSAPQLTHLSVHDTLVDDTEEEWPLHIPAVFSSIPMPRLTSLRLALLGSGQPLESGILLALSAPRLAALVVKNPTYAGLTPFATSPGSASKYPLLRSLTFCEYDYNSAERLRPLAEALPGVTHFTRLTSSYSEPSVLLMLAGAWVDIGHRKTMAGDSDSGSELWVELHTINTTLDICDLPLLRRAVERRIRVGFPLRVVRLPQAVFDEADEEDEEDMVYLRENLQVFEPLRAMERWPPGEEHDPEDNLFT
ncbi:F-box domain-containing protein [Mycena chlorophos]|uniref:F-box domain-containing protein n=1 Tax=Mycena chlorophos TaxID=658473 RepID=A0A8H6WB63_MYCCL|nr:F-box domain-containing protein [Mycena chlorophos]